MDRKIIDTIRKIKPKFAFDGFIILGVFGSYAREEETPRSDIDILYEVNPDFVNKYRGFQAYRRLDEIRNELSGIFHRDIDITDKDALGEIGRKYILSEVKYVG